MPTRTPGLVLVQSQITQSHSPCNMEPASPFFARVRCVFCCGSVLHWLLGWSEQPPWPLQLRRAQQGDMGGRGPSPFGSSDGFQSVRSSHEITSCETERRAGHGRVSPPQVSRINTLRTLGDARIPQPKPLHPHLAPRWARNPAVHRSDRAAPPPPAPPLPSPRCPAAVTRALTPRWGLGGSR